MSENVPSVIVYGQRRAPRGLARVPALVVALLAAATAAPAGCGSSSSSSTGTGTGTVPSGSGSGPGSASGSGSAPASGSGSASAPAPAPAYAIERVELGPPQPVMLVRDRVPLTELEATLTKSMPRLIAHVVASQMQMAAPPYIRYLQIEGDMVEFEAGLPVVKAGAGGGDIQPGELPGGSALVTVHVGAYENLFAAHDALRRWAEERGIPSAGPPWNIFVDNPLAEPDPAKRRTQVVMPINPIQ